MWNRFNVKQNDICHIKQNIDVNILIEKNI